MNVDYTGRQVEISPAIRTQTEHGLDKLKKLFGDDFHTHVILSTEKRRCKAEITLALRDHPLVGVAEAATMSQAISGALEHVGSQAVKYKTRLRSKKRNAAKKSSKSNGNLRSANPREPSPEVAAPNGSAMMAHNFPEVTMVTEAHVVPSNDAVAKRPLTIDEAIKEAEFRDHEVFVFRDMKGNVKVLHRKKDGKLELIEA